MKQSQKKNYKQIVKRERKLSKKFNKIANEVIETHSKTLTQLRSSEFEHEIFELKLLLKQITQQWDDGVRQAGFFKQLMDKAKEVIKV